MALAKKHAPDYISIRDQGLSLEKMFNRSFRDTLSKEEFAYRDNLIKKLEAAEEDIRKGRTTPHAKMVSEVKKWFKLGGPKKRLKI